MSNYGDDEGLQLPNSPTVSLFKAPKRSCKVYKLHLKTNQKNHQDNDNIVMDDVVSTIDLI